MRPNILAGLLDRRRILFRVVDSGNACSSLKYSVWYAFVSNPGNQQIWYTPVRTMAESTMQNTADSLFAENQEKNGGPNLVSRLFVGTNGIMMKAATMDAIKNYDNLDDKDTLLDKSTH